MKTISIQITILMDDEAENSEIRFKEQELTDDIRAYLESMKHSIEGPWSNLGLVTIKGSFGNAWKSASRIK